MDTVKKLDNVISLCEKETDEMGTGKITIKIIHCESQCYRREKKKTLIGKTSRKRMMKGVKYVVIIVFNNPFWNKTVAKSFFVLLF